MIKIIKAFSLIEVIIATSILTIAVFWVYKLIWENSKIINNSWNYFQINSLFPVLEECIENIWFDSFTQNNYEFNFWLTGTWCVRGVGNKVIIDNLEYKLSWVITWSWSDYNNWELTISSDATKWVTQNYKQIKK